MNNADKIVRLMDKHARGITTGDYVMMKESKDDLVNLIANIEQGETLLKGEIGNLFLCKNCREKNGGFFSKLGLF